MDFIDPLPHPRVLEHCQKEALVIRKCSCEQDWKMEGFRAVGDLGTEPTSLVSPVLANGFFTTRAT